eukprot:1194356-Prorocentrum_minimum.AAC.3
MPGNSIVSTLAGTGEEGYRADGDDTDIKFNQPGGVAVDRAGNVIVADCENHRIREISPQGLVSTIAGTGEQGHRDGASTARARSDGPCGVAVDRDGNIIVADSNNHCIRKISPQGLVSTLAGTGVEGHQDGEGTAAQFNNPCDVARVDGGGNVIVADYYNHRIRKVSPQGLVFTLAGTGVEGHQDGEGTAAQFCWPCGVAVDGAGNVIVADEAYSLIRKISPQGLVSTLAGTGEEGHRDGDSAAAQFCGPCGVVVDGAGNVIVGDCNNNRIRKISPQGVVSTLAGNGKEGYREGYSAAAQFNCPSGVTLDGEGNILVADVENHCIRVVVSAEVSPPTSLHCTAAMPPVPPSTFPSDMRDSFHDVCFVVEQQRVPAHRYILSARCAYFRTMLSDGFRESDSPEIPIHGTTCAAFQALLKYLYTDSTEVEVEEEVLFDLARLSDQYQVERLFTHCMQTLAKGITHKHAVMRLIQAHACKGGDMWAKLQSVTKEYVARNLKEIWRDAKPTMELLVKDHQELFMEILWIRLS